MRSIERDAPKQGGAYSNDVKRDNPNLGRPLNGIYRLKYAPLWKTIYYKGSLLLCTSQTTCVHTNFVYKSGNQSHNGKPNNCFNHQASPNKFNSFRPALYKGAILETYKHHAFTATNMA